MKVLPISIENFKEIADKNIFYIDKTDFVSEVIRGKLYFT